MVTEKLRAVFSSGLEPSQGRADCFPRKLRDPAALRFLPVPSQTQLKQSRVPGPQVCWERVLARLAN